MNLDSEPQNSRLLYGHTLNAVLAYEDFSTGMHALRTFDHLFLNANQNPQFGIGTRNVWKFDLLGVPKLREAAISEAAQANLIVISMHGPGDLPANVRQWIHGWASSRGEETGSLVMLVDGTKSDSTSRLDVEAYLEDTARNAKMDYYIQKVESRHALERQQITTSTQKDWQAFEILTQIMPAASEGLAWRVNA